MGQQRCKQKIVVSFIISFIVQQVSIPQSFAITIQALSSTVTKQEKISSLGPEGFQESVNKNMSCIFIMDLYAENMRNQSTTDFSNANQIDKDLQTQIVEHNTQAKKNAIEWQQVIKPSMLENTQNIIQFNDTFQEISQVLSEAIEKKNKDKIKKQVEQLYAQVKKNRQKTDTILKKINDFQQGLNTDQQNYNADFIELQPILNTMGMDIPKLQQKIKNLNDEIKKQSVLLQQGEALCWKIFGCVVGAPMIIHAKIKITILQEEISQLMNNIYGVQRAMAVVSDVQNKIGNIEKTIKVVIGAFQQISTQWSTMQVKYENVLKSIDKIDSEGFKLMQSKLNIAKEEWQGLKGYVERLSELYSTDGSNGKVLKYDYMLEKQATTEG
ncbi:hemolytic enterotoxin [Bacillus thuringiensis]|uniref:HBL/NHE enterotoxin family protein n=1 Tax=Bacillus thuringiensis TaxID=1428 RepID=UPI000BFA58A1|nr:HBL/NHE enterotoxin family protein [Bacillus thuringiensis]PEZ46363.1 hemolytic enterotoxin [Bacillus thuringiensis]PGY62888.1 hemolytic enterotoxin [Bacillus thuringiensis]